MGIGDWGLGIWGWGPNQNAPIPNPQSPIPNPQLKNVFLIIYKILLIFKLNFYSLKKKYIIILYNVRTN